MHSTCPAAGLGRGGRVSAASRDAPCRLIDLSVYGWGAEPHACNVTAAESQGSTQPTHWLSFQRQQQMASLAPRCRSWCQPWC